MFILKTVEVIPIKPIHRQTFFSGEKLLTFKNVAAAKEEENTSSYKRSHKNNSLDKQNSSFPTL